MKKPNQLSKKEQERQERLAKRRLELEQEHDNIRKDFAKWFDLSADIGKFFATKEDYVKSKLREDEEAILIVPQGIYQDPEEVCVIYQQNFVDMLCKTTPQVIGDLRPLVSSFGILFGDFENYVEIIEELKLNAFNNCKIDFGEFEPTNDNIWNKYDYVWRRLKILLLFSLYNYKTPINDNNLIIPIELECQYQKEVNSIGKNLTDSTIKFSIERFRNLVEKTFQNIASKPNLSFLHFLRLQIQILNWTEYYHLKKDWLVNYSYEILSQLRKKKNAMSAQQACAIQNQDFYFSTLQNKVNTIEPLKKLNKIPINKEIFIPQRKYISETWMYDFSFRYEGWRASKVKAEDYRKKIIEEFVKELAIYFDSAHRHLRLDQKANLTRQRRFDNLKYLIAWNEGATRAQIAEVFCVSTETVKTETNELKEYNLPIRKGEQGKKKTLKTSKDRLKEIKDLDIRSYIANDYLTPPIS